MKNPTIRKLILKRFREKYLQGNNEWVNAQTIEDKLHETLGKKHETIGRTLRLMAEDSLLEKNLMTLKEGGVKSIWYRYVPSTQEKQSLLFKMQNKLL